jgi:hypothetical protein
LRALNEQTTFIDLARLAKQKDGVLRVGDSIQPDEKDAILSDIRLNCKFRGGLHKLTWVQHHNGASACGDKNKETLIERVFEKFGSDWRLHLTAITESEQPPKQNEVPSNADGLPLASAPRLIEHRANAEIRERAQFYDNNNQHYDNYDNNNQQHQFHDDNGFGRDEWQDDEYDNRPQHNAVIIPPAPPNVRPLVSASSSVSRLQSHFGQHQNIENEFNSRVPLPMRVPLFSDDAAQMIASAVVQAAGLFFTTPQQPHRTRRWSSMQTPLIQNAPSSPMSESQIFVDIEGDDDNNKTTIDDCADVDNSVNGNANKRARH